MFPSGRCPAPWPGVHRTVLECMDLNPRRCMLHEKHLLNVYINLRKTGPDLAPSLLCRAHSNCRCPLRHAGEVSAKRPCT